MSKFQLLDRMIALLGETPHIKAALEALPEWERSTMADKLNQLADEITGQLRLADKERKRRRDVVWAKVETTITGYGNMMDRLIDAMPDAALVQLIDQLEAD